MSGWKVPLAISGAGSTIGTVVGSGVLAVVGASWAFLASVPIFEVVQIALLLFIVGLVLWRRTVQVTAGESVVLGTLLSGEGILRIPEAPHVIQLTRAALSLYRATQDQNDLRKIHSRFADEAERRTQFCVHDVSDAVDGKAFRQVHGLGC